VAKQFQSAGGIDIDLLREISRKYPLSARPEAMSFLADLLIDRRQWRRSLLRQLQQLPPGNVPSWRTLARLAVALSMAQQHQAALQVVE
jgi:hypothetical protein